MQVKIKPELKDAPLLNEEQKQSDEPYGTVWPKKIGKGDGPQQDDKIRDVWGNVLG